MKGKGNCLYNNKLWKRVSSFVLALIMAVSMLPAMPSIEVKAEDVQTAMFPLSLLSISCGRGEGKTATSKGHTGSSYNAVDFRWNANDCFHAYAPFDGTIVRMVPSYHAVWFQSDREVRYADGSVKKMCMLIEHCDWEKPSLWVGKKVKQGEVLLHVGGWGPKGSNQYPVHYHIETMDTVVAQSNDQNTWPARGNVNIEDALKVNKAHTKRITCTHNKAGAEYNFRYYNGNNPIPGPSTLSISGETRPTGNLTQGKGFGIYGTITSNYLINNVTAVVFDQSGNPMSCCNCSYNPNSYSVNLHGKANNELIFNNLPAGKYTYVVAATDTSPKTIEFFRQEFTVGEIPSVDITDPTPVDGGVKVSFSCNRGSIYYTTNGSDPRTSGTGISNGGSINLTGTANVQAVAISNGVQSNVVSKYVTVGSLATPSISSEIGSNAVTVSITADFGARIYYTTNGSNPSASSAQYTGAFQVKDSVTVKAIAVKAGSSNSGIATRAITVKTPDTPTLKVNGNSKVAVDDAVQVTWNKQDVAYSYTVKLAKDGATVKEDTISGTKYAFTLPEVGDYSITVKANNFKGSSAESYPPVTVTAMAPVTVTFKDWDDSVISTQTVRYGYKPEISDIVPTRRGYNFTKWDNSKIYGNITESIVAKAQYTKKRYIVKFVDENGNNLAAQQEIPFEESVTLPADPTTDKPGYEFMGWRCVSSDSSSALDYNSVDANMTLVAVFDWPNKNLPVNLFIDSAERVDATHYVVKVSVEHYDQTTANTTGRVLATLKTSNGKMVKTQMQEFSIKQGESKKQLQPIEMVCDQVATQIEVSAVATDGTKTTGTVAKSVSSITTDAANIKWSDWSTQQPGAGLVTESMTKYRYRNKQYTNSEAGWLDGWNQYGTPDVSYGGWGGTQETTSNPGGSDTLEVTGTSDTYYWYHYCNKYSGKSQIDSIQYGSRDVRHTTTSNWMFPALNIADKGGRQCYGGQGTGAPACTWNFYGWWLENKVTTYYYHTRSKTVTYHYWKWGDWSQYQDNNPGSNGDREVQSITYYRYQIPQATSTDGEDLEGVTYSEQGKIDKIDVDLSGKHADILVYKSTNNDPTENQLEYVGHTIIGDENAYDFSFIPKETPDQAESNYIVAFAIEGSSDIFNIDVIYASKPHYTVTFYDKEGQLIDTVDVEEGACAQAPDAPEVAGYSFIGWDKDTTDIRADRAVTAQYIQNKYTAVYVDFEINQISMEELVYGDPLPNKAPEELIEGKTFVGWESKDGSIIDGTQTISENSIMKAKYDVEDFTVDFVDEEGNSISSQTIKYGEAAQAPAAPAVADDKEFLGWSTDNSWWNVKSNMTVKPIVTYKESASAPIYEIENTYLGGVMKVDVPSNQKVYYMIKYEDEDAEDEGYAEEIPTNGGEDEEVVPETSSDELGSHIHPFDELVCSECGTDDEEAAAGGIEEDWTEYTEEILLYGNAKVYLKAQGENMNESIPVEIDYTYEEVENPYTKTAKVEMPRVSGIKDGYVEVPIKVIDNPGMMGAGFTFKYDPDIVDEVSVEAGEVFKDGYFNNNVDAETGDVRILWNDVDAVTATGTLFTVKLHILPGVKEGDYSFDLTYEPEDTFDQNFQDMKIELNGNGTISVGEEKTYTIGDVNEDTKVNNKDVALIARFLVGKNDLTDSQMKAADTNGDNRVNNKDVAKLARYLVGKETSLGGK